MIKRDSYLEQLIKARDDGMPKVITGIRRCGKSYLMKEIYVGYLLEDGVKEDHILFLELDDDKNALLRDPVTLGEYVRDFCKDKGKCYVFLDEVQMVYSLKNPALTNGEHILAKNNDRETITFVDVILGLSREDNIDLYVTGSNSRMLSSDIVTQFRDKSEIIPLAPLSFEEYYGYVGGSETEAFYEYMQYGGMPLAVLKDEAGKKEYLRGLFETVYFKDIVEHNELRKSESFDELCDVISSSLGTMLNAEKIANTYRSEKKEKIDKQTVEKYIGFFTDSFLIRKAYRFDIKGRAEIGALRKYYFTDVGLRNARTNFAYADEGQLLENIVYNELLYNGYSVNVGTFESVEKDSDGKSVRKNYEVDFYAVKSDRRYYIQATTDISDEETRMREIRPYMLLNDGITKIVVVNKPIKQTFDENGFTVIGVTDFLLRYIK